MNDIEFLQSQLGNGDGFADELAKSITSTAGFVGYNLEPEAALILPYFAGLRARIPTDKAALGATQATWKAQLGYGSLDFTTWGSSETGTGLATNPSATQFQAPYLQQALKGDVSYISMLMARGFDDPMNVETSNVLSGLLKLEEYILLLGNNAALSAPSGIVGTPSTDVSPATFAAGTWNVRVTALTGQGAVANASSNSNTGETAAGSVAVVVPTGGVTFLDIAVPAVPNAVAYKFYIERTAGGGTFYLCRPAVDLKYAKYTSGVIDYTTVGDAIVVPTGQTFPNGVDHVQIVAIPPNTQPTVPGSDGSANALTFEGLLAWCEKTSIYSQSVTHYNTDLSGAPFTTIGTGVLEIDNFLETQWTVNNMSPTLIIGSAKTVRSLGNAIIKTAQVPTYQVQIGQERGAFTGGVFLGGYTNKFAMTMLQGQEPIIPVWSHPYLTDGKLMFISEDIPAASYRYSRKGKAFSLDVLSPYTYFELARTALSIPFSTFWSETLKCYHMSAQGSISGIRVDS